MKFKTSLKDRQAQASWKLSNWEKVKAYQREYMRNWRSREPGKTIIKLANATYYKKTHLAQLLYQELVKLAKEDAMFGKGKKPRRVRREWKLAA